MVDNILSQHLQDNFACLAIRDDHFLKIVRFAVPSEYFSSSITEKIIDICYAYYDQFKEAPKQHFDDEFKRSIYDLDEDDQRPYFLYLRKLKKLAAPNIDYIIRSVSEFVKARSFEIAADKFMRLVENKQTEEAKTVMFNALKSGIPAYDRGLAYAENDIPTYSRSSNENILMKSGIKCLDKLIKGYKRTQFVCFLGSSKGKKSWALIHLAKQALLNQLNVVYITHEISAELVERRLDMMFGSLTDEDFDEEVEFRKYDNFGEVSKVDNIVRETTKNIKSVQNSRAKYKGMIGKLFIKKYPMGSCSVHEIENYLNYLETYESFVPDVLINDYIDIMDLSRGSGKSETRDQVNWAYIQHKRLADEKNMLVVTVSQAKRDAIRKAKPSMKDFSEDIRKVSNVDLAIAIAETDEEAENNIMRLLIVAGRSVKMDVGCCVAYNLNVGQFATESWFMEYAD